ncbi:hypothetical protein RJT34_23411 [Clitoria ternatea]|uniref:Mitochondrial succinate-fumarate transporter 1 n=1 Tax=Clitoria ternatea TaxID=43366 RepID=A0AAN9FSR0_CLITE
MLLLFRCVHQSPPRDLVANHHSLCDLFSDYIDNSSNSDSSFNGIFMSSVPYLLPLSSFVCFVLCFDVLILILFEAKEIKPPSIMKQDAAQDNTNSYPKKSIPPYMKAISGSLGGIVEASCLQPIDVIKTRLQLDRLGNYKGIVHCGTTIAQAEGMRALWKGLTPFATHLTLKYALRMGSNAVLQSVFKDLETGKVSNHGRLLSGFGAGVLEAVLIVTPFEVVKIRLQQQKGLSPELLRYKGPIHCAGMIIKEEGFRGLWAGVAPTVMRNGINQSAMFTAKNAFDVLLWKKHEGDGKVLQPWQSMISGFLAGTTGPICTGPFDVVKTRLMAQTRVRGELKYKGMIHAIRTIFVEEGLLALWKGLLPRLMRIPPGQAIMWAVSDQIIGLYEKRYH